MQEEITVVHSITVTAVKAAEDVRAAQRAQGDRCKCPKGELQVRGSWHLGGVSLAGEGAHVRDPPAKPGAEWHL